MKVKFILGILLFPVFCYPQTIDLRKFTDPMLGENVFVFNPDMNMKDIQAVIDTAFGRQSARRSEFSSNRYALLFRPGHYDLDVKVNYYMTVLGLGDSPRDVVIRGAVRSNTTHGKSVLTNFWRSVENLTIEPGDSVSVWGVSQAAPMRRVYIRGKLQLFDIGYASGGFLADSKIEGTVASGPQQQWFSRNCEIGKWDGGVWNMMFLGVKGAPEENWPDKPYTTIKETPLIREKPYLIFNGKRFAVRVPEIRKNSEGISWNSKKNADRLVPMKEFYLAKPGTDNSTTLNTVLRKGMNIIFTPGIYKLEESLLIAREGTIILGIGMPSLMPVNGNSAIESSDVGGITIGGLTIDAGPVASKVLLSIGDPGSNASFVANPSFLFDIFFRVGGPSEGSAEKCMVVNSSDVFIDHTWIWRADHGNGVGWDKNKCANGLVVDGDNVTVYGLFNEHFQEYQTLWNGNNGRVYFYQSEMPYDPPSVDAWKHDGTNGYASYKVADHVKSHEAWGVGIYNVFYDAPVIVDNAIETPEHLENQIHHKVIFWLNGNKESVVKSIINGKGGSVNVSNRKAVMR
jgi:hypothetical protein